MNFFIFLINSVSWDFRKGQTVGGKPIELKVTLTKEVMLMIDKKIARHFHYIRLQPISPSISEPTNTKLILKKLRKKRKKKKGPEMDHSVLTCRKFTNWWRWVLVEYKEKKKNKGKTKFCQSPYCVQEESKNAAGKTRWLPNAPQPSNFFR